MKVCRGCGAEKPLSEYHRRRDSKDGRQYRCKPCARADVRDSRARRRDEVRAQARRYHRERMSTPEGREQARRWARTTHQRHRARRNAKALARYAARRARGWEGVLRRDPCAYCGRSGGEVDHIHALALGGSSEPDNLTGACGWCNRSKGTRPLLALLLDNRNRIGWADSRWVGP